MKFKRVARRALNMAGSVKIASELAKAGIDLVDADRARFARLLKAGDPSCAKPGNVRDDEHRQSAKLILKEGRHHAGEEGKRLG